MNQFKTSISRPSTWFWLVTGVIFIAVLVATVIYVWPTPWRYEHLTLKGSSHPVRIHRVTGKTEVLYQEGWESVDAEPLPTTPAQDLRLPIDALRRVEKGQLQITNYGWIEAEIYNGNERRIREVRVRLIVVNPNGSEEINREYNLSTSLGEPLQSSKFSANCGCNLEKEQRMRWSITQASWR